MSVPPVRFPTLGLCHEAMGESKVNRCCGATYPELEARRRIPRLPSRRSAAHTLPLLGRHFSERRAERRALDFPIEDTAELEIGAGPPEAGTPRPRHRHRRPRADGRRRPAPDPAAEEAQARPEGPDHDAWRTSSPRTSSPEAVVRARPHRPRLRAVHGAVGPRQCLFRRCRPARRSVAPIEDAEAERGRRRPRPGVRR